VKKQATILLVEDDESLLCGIADLLEITDMGYTIRVIKATNGLDGLAVLNEVTADLIVSDIMMPQMDGLEFLARVRQNPAWVHVPLIFLTARGEKGDIHQGRLTGAEMYITKPFDNRELLELVKSQLDRTFQLQLARHNKLEKLKRGILQLLNHEFRTPLTYVTAYYEMLAESLDSDSAENLPEYLRGIQTGCVRLTRLVEDLVTVIEIRTGELLATYQARARLVNNVGELLREAGVSRQAQAATAAVNIHYLIPDYLAPVWGDPELLLDSFDRLVENAIKFTRARRLPGGEVVLSATTGESEVHLTVRDNGIGFPDHVYDFIFEPFYQHNREVVEQQGSGSGLTIARGVVEMHGGRVTVESEEGRGSAFTVVLPLYASNGLHQPRRRHERQKQATILVVEDDLFLLDGLRELLEVDTSPYSFKVMTAANGLDGLRLLAEHQPDLIISDIMMPQMDGYQFLERVRQNPAWLQIPFIFLTAKGERQDIHRGRRSGAEQYITKPYDSDKLLELIVTQLHRYFQIQGVVAQGFDTLKRSILDLLQPNIRRPLSTMTDYSHKLALSLENAQTEEELKESLHGLKAASHRLTKVIEDFITLAELRTGEALSTFRMRARPLDVRALLYQAVAVREAELHSGGGNLVLNLEQDLPPVLGDDETLLNAVERLLAVAVNLAEHSRESKIYLSAEEQDGHVVMAIWVTRGRFDASKCDAMAALFRDRELSTLELGDAGPSLAIVKGIIDLHEGWVTMENIGNGGSDHGCRFSLGLPVYLSDTAPQHDV
jgi:two-component system, sensor histidine kinase and response regulator